MPVWLLLQPRGHLGGYFLYVALAVGAIGVLFGNFPIQYDAFKGWDAVGKNGETFFPFLFITIACGACSGFHSLIASGTTSKQLRLETDAKPIGYGAMLLEAMVATLALACVMILKPTDALAQQSPNQIYAGGLSEFLGVLGVAKGFAVAFGLMAFTTFVYDTLDVCTRLGRYIVQELTGLENWAGRWLGTAPHGRRAAAARAAQQRRRGRQPGARLADVLVPVRREQSIAGRADAVGRDGLALADAASDVGLVRHRPADRLHVHDEHLGPGGDDAAEVLRRRDRSISPHRPIRCRGPASC